MCTSIVEIAAADGMAKGEQDWFAVTEAVVAYDHARHAWLYDAITIDFVNRELPPGARAAVELTLDSAKALRDALTRAIAAAEIEESERRQPVDMDLLGLVNEKPGPSAILEPRAAKLLVTSAA